VPDRPNILIVLTDQQERRALSCTGNRWLRTPAMDSIINSGVWFEHAYCPSPVCGPSRAALMTGRMPHELNVDVNDGPFRTDIPTFGEVFRAAGYDTGYAGKWHLPEHYFFGPGDHDVRGFRMLGLPIPAKRYLNGAEADGPATDRAIAFLAEKRDRPFLLVASLHNPHDICSALGGRRMLKPTDPADLPPLPENFPRDADEPQFISDCRQRRHYGNEQNFTTDWSLTRWREYLYTYYRYVEMADAQVARLLSALHQSGQADNTIVIFMSDHGEGVAAHQWVVKLMLYEEEVGVPLAISWPKRIKPGRRSDPVSLVDIMPTICDFAGIAPPSSAGLSLRPITEHGGTLDRACIVSELQPDTKDASRIGRMVRTQRFKYVAFSYGRNPEMLFDHEADPGELRNLALVPDAAATLAEHRALLADWCRQTADRFVPAGDTLPTRG